MQSPESSLNASRAVTILSTEDLPAGHEASSPHPSIAVLARILVKTFYGKV